MHVTVKRYGAFVFMRGAAVSVPLYAFRDHAGTTCPFESVAINWQLPAA